MKKIHAKSPCCRGVVRRFGGRRRQCDRCGKTWSIRRKKSGRKRRRAPKSLVRQYLDHALPSTYGRSRHLRVSSDFFERRLLKSRNLFNRTTSWASLPMGSNICVVDAKIQKVMGRRYSIYLILARPVGGKTATIAPPLILPGGESEDGWRRAFEALPASFRSHTRAIVCDGHRGPLNYAKAHSILIQRCHFHLLASIRQRRSRWKRNGDDIEQESVYRLVMKAITVKSERRAVSLLTEIDNLGLASPSYQLRIILQGFVHYYEYFRMYRYHPKLDLPTTTNAAESCVGSIHELCHRARGFRSIFSLSSWIEALLKHKRTITCNGFQQRKRG